MRKAQPRHVEATWRKAGRFLDLFVPVKCPNYPEGQATLPSKEACLRQQYFDAREIAQTLVAARGEPLLYLDGAFGRLVRPVHRGYTESMWLKPLHFFSNLNGLGRGGT